jgi:undecaprenyl-diphosphatase
MKLSAILELDARTSERLRIAESPGPLRTLAAVLAHSGDSWFWGAGLLVLWFFSGSFWKHWAILMLAAISVLAAMVLVLKFSIRRRRPEGQWGSIYRNTDPHSFPSGHAARAFMLAVIATGLGPAGIAIAIWMWAPLVALARVAMGVHYLSDVVAGLVIGLLVGGLALQIQQPFLNWLATIVRMPLW